MVVELKWNKDSATALQQIKDKQYPESILNYTGDILLVGINYDKGTKEHQCMIEKYEKDWLLLLIVNIHMDVDKPRNLAKSVTVE